MAETIKFTAQNLSGYEFYVRVNGEDQLQKSATLHLDNSITESDVRTFR